MIIRQKNGHSQRLADAPLQLINFKLVLPSYFALKFESRSFEHVVSTNKGIESAFS